MRIVFMGTPAFAVPTLTEILARGHEIAAVYTRAPKPSGRRGLALPPSPVHALAARMGLPVLTPASLRSAEAAEAFREHKAEVAVVAAYGLILPKAVLEEPLQGCLNLHASLLPRWRGAAPIHRAVMAGDAESGVMVMRMEEGLDTGPVGASARVAIGPNETTGELHDRLAALGATLMADALDALGHGLLRFEPQAEAGVAYARKIEKSERCMDWSRPAKEVHDHIRGLSPYPGAAFEVDLGRGPELVRILRSELAEGGGEPGRTVDAALSVACGSGAVRLLELQRAGRERLPASDFLRGAPIPAGALLR